MPYLDASVLAWLLGFIQIAGLLSAWLARLNEGSPSQTWFQRLFVVCLFLMGLTTMTFVGVVGTRYWLALGATFSVMVLAAVWDFRPHTVAEPR